MSILNRRKKVKARLVAALSSKKKGARRPAVPLAERERKAPATEAAPS